MTHLPTKSFISILTITFVVCFLSSTNLEAKNPKSEDTKVLESTERTELLKPVRGFVVDEFGEPMVGVIVNALGSLKSTITNTEGKYTLLANGNDILKFSQIGAVDKEEKITSSRIVNVELAVE